MNLQRVWYALSISMPSSKENRSFFQPVWHTGHPCAHGIRPPWMVEVQFLQEQKTARIRTGVAKILLSSRQ
jgi:hypothetical protein